MIRASTVRPLRAAVYAATLLGLAAVASPAAAYSVTVQLVPFPNCQPGHVNSFCSLRVIVKNGNQAVLPPNKHQVRIVLRQVFQVAAAVQSGGTGNTPTNWACAIAANGRAVTCVNNGPPVPANRTLSEITMRIRLLKVARGPDGRICARAGVYKPGNVLISPAASHCVDITIVP